MTNIRVRYVPPGSDEPQPGWIRFIPRSFDAGRPIAEGPDVLVGDTGQIEIEPGMNSIEVRPTSSGWYYAVQGRAGRHSFSTNVLVPPSGEHDFESLVRVDPKAGGLEYEPDPEWRADLDSIRHMGGIPGQDGADAYQIAVREGYAGTEQEWLESLVGPAGPHGDRGPQGSPGVTDLATSDEPGLMSAEDKVKLDAITTPEDFGAAGDGVTDDTEAFRDMLAGSTRRFSPDPTKRYRISGQLNFGRTSHWNAPLKLTLTGSRTATGADDGAQTGGGAQHLTALVMQGEHSGDSIDVELEVHPTSPWLAIIGNDFYLHGLNSWPEYPTSISFGSIRIVADSYVTGYTGDGNAAIRFQSMDSINISRLHVENFQFVYRHSHVTDAGVGTESVTMRNFRSGVQVTRSESCTAGDVIAYGSTDDKHYGPGANALVIRAVENFVAGDVTVYDPGEHGVRITSSYGEEGGTTLGTRLIRSRATFGHVKVYRPGGSGFKAASGGDTNLPEIELVRIGSLYVEDAGTSDYDEGGTFTGNNHFGLTLQNVTSFSATSYITRRVNALHNGKNALMVRGGGNFYLGTMQAGGTYGDVIFWNATSSTYNVEIGGGYGYEYGRGGSGFLMSFLNRGRMGRVRIRMDAQSGPSLIRFSGDENGTPASFWDIETTYHAVTDSSVVGGTTNRTRIATRPSTGPENSGAVGYAAGDMLFCAGQAGQGSTLRNGLVDVYLMGDSSRGFVAVPVGFTPSVSVGNQVPGTWRARGQSADGAYLMVQKVGA